MNRKKWWYNSAKNVFMGVFIVLLQVWSIQGCTENTTSGELSAQAEQNHEHEVGQNLDVLTTSSAVTCPRGTVDWPGGADHTPPCNGEEDPGEGLRCFGYAASRAFWSAGFTECFPECMGWEDRINNGNSPFFERIEVLNESDFLSKVCVGDIIEYGQSLHYAFVTKLASTPPGTLDQIFITDANRNEHGKVRSWMQRRRICDEEGCRYIESEEIPMECGIDYRSTEETAQKVKEDRGMQAITGIIRPLTINYLPPATPVVEINDPANGNPRHFKWNGDDIADGYKVYRRLDSYPGNPNGTYELIADFTETEYYDTSVELWSEGTAGPRATAFYKVVSYHRLKQSDDSNIYVLDVRDLDSNDDSF